VEDAHGEEEIKQEENPLKSGRKMRWTRIMKGHCDHGRRQGKNR
jgi:hypothetical protein